MNENNNNCNYEEELVQSLKASSCSAAMSSYDKASTDINDGDLVFSYKNSEHTLFSVTIRKNNKYTSPEKSKDFDYSVEVISTSCSYIYPHVPRTFLEQELYELLEKFKLEEEVLITYKQIIEDLKQ